MTAKKTPMLGQDLLDKLRAKENEQGMFYVLVGFIPANTSYSIKENLESLDDLREKAREFGAADIEVEADVPNRWVLE